MSKLNMHKICKRCNEEKDLSLFCYNKHTEDGFNSYCKKCINELQKINRIKTHSDKKYYAKLRKNNERIKEYSKKYRDNNPVKVRYNAYVQNAKIRGFIFLLTIDEFLEIVNKPCHYCGKESIIEYKKMNGIDRKDSNIGYLKENCLPCCFRCNEAKNNCSYDEFINWICKVYNNMGGKIWQNH